MRFVPILILLTSTGAFAALPDTIRTTEGQVSGIPGKEPTMRIFKGIPYAAPPTGMNRWRAPQPAAKWDGVRKAETFSPTCATGAAPGKGKASTASEDCLYVNVWTGAQSAGEKRPVFVWTYGGGFTGGSGSEGRYDGEALANKGLVVVTYNYRLGTFGFFAHPELAKESGHNASGNYGMHDMHAALQWVQKNIAAFGGDPGRVTIAGESAGGILVGAMVASPEGKGLFQRAISQSAGFMGLSIAKTRTRAQAEEAGAKAAGTNTLAQLRDMSTEQIGQNLRGVQAGLIVDGWMIPEDPAKTFAAGKQIKVDVLLGSNQDEGTFFGGGAGNAEQFKSQAQQRYGDLTADYLKLYPAATNEEAAASNLARTRDEVGWHMRTWAQAQVKGGKKAYLFYFTRVAPGQTRGATHTAELPYMFQNPPATGWADVDHKLSDQMSTYWVNFVTTGDPNGKGLPAWTAYDPKKNDAQAMVFGNTTEFGAHIEAARLAFFDKAYAAFLKQ
jgi:para-nitrobenzyl esterase